VVGVGAAGGGVFVVVLLSLLLPHPIHIADVSSTISAELRTVIQGPLSYFQRSCYLIRCSAHLQSVARSGARKSTYKVCFLRIIPVAPSSSLQRIFFQVPHDARMGVKTSRCSREEQLTMRRQLNRMDRFSCILAAEARVRASILFQIGPEYQEC
jgi:hypothetical protein